ncbi:oxalate:formate antiporter [Photobacterium sanctipauli]|uniref:Oxalate:formate antiporter n=1 Tax=Photobacterium sanctipauli TaxID=1342794 RepID=A0A2T3P101_9GAMM|nr:aminoglycoside 6-adenylyltransferase [Photobacterium sanctipauli]PSW22180.1 oxalate:formate antiporter [Photobacterium sanctipauli]
MKFPTSLPSTHQALLEKIIAMVSSDERFVGLSAAGSYASNTMDDYSDLDLVVAVDPAAFDDVMASRSTIVNQIDGLVAHFTGEHVGEPRLVIALYEGAVIVHVDFKFVSLPDAAQRVDDPVVLWQRGSCLSDVLAQSESQYPQPNPQWIEDRFWVWVHYAATKIARGEYFETLEFISFLRQNALSPLALAQAGETPEGVRKIEHLIPDFAQKLEATIATNNAESLGEAVYRCVDIYRELRANIEGVECNHTAEKLSLAYLKQILS